MLLKFARLTENRGMCYRAEVRKVIKDLISDFSFFPLDNQWASKINVECADKL
jgi:hypothetical protein